MKNLKEFVNGRYISFEGLSEEEIEKLSNLKDHIIGECCCDCDCGCECPSPCACDDPCVGGTCNTIGTAVPASAPIEVDMQTRAIETFRSKVYSLKVQDIYSLSASLEPKGRFVLDPGKISKEPYYIQSYDSSTTLGLCKGLHDYVMELASNLGLSYPTVYVNSENMIQVFFLKHSGTNGKEGSIKSSLSEAVKLLNKLEAEKEVTWAQVIDISIDSLDDLYTFLFTCTIESARFEEEMKKRDDIPQPISPIAKIS